MRLVLLWPVFLFFFSLTSHAQTFSWTPYPPGTGGPWGGSVRRIIAADPVTGRNLWAATAGGIYRSLDGGQSWQARNNGLKTLNFADIAVSAQDGNFLIAAARIGGLYKTVDGGASWTQVQVKNGYVPVNFMGTAAIDPVDKNHLFAGSYEEGAANYLFESTDGGQTWSNIYSATPTRLRFVFDQNTQKHLLFFSTITGYLRKYDGGYFPVVGGPFKDSSNLNSPILDFDMPGMANETIAVAASRAGFRVSTSGGASWTSFTKTDDNLDPLTATAVSCDASSTTRLLMFFFDFNSGVSGGLFLSQNLLGTTPVKVSLPEDGMYFNTLLSSASGDFLGENIAGVFSRSDKSQPFQHGSTGMSAFSVADFDFASTGQSSSTGGHGFAVSGGGIVVKSGNSGLNLWVPYQGSGYWVRRKVGDLSAANGAYPGSTRLVRYQNDNTLWTSIEGFTLYRSADQGQSWTLTSNMTDTDVATNSVYGMEFALSTNIMLFGGSGGVYYSTDNGWNWNRSSGLSGSDYILGRDVSNNTSCFAAGKTSGIYRSTDGGITWARSDGNYFLNPTRSLIPIKSFEASKRVPGHILVGDDYYGLFESFDYGTSWTPISGDSGLPWSGSYGPLAFANSDGDMLAAVSVYGDGVYITGDGGGNWTRVTAGIELANLSVPEVTSLKFTPDGKALVAGLDGLGMYSLALGEMPVMTSTGPYTLFAGRSYNIKLAGSDPDGGNVTFGATSIPQAASFAVDTMSWTPGVSDVGARQCVFYISDGFYKRYYTVTLNVAPPNNPPVMSPIGDKDAVVGRLLQFTLSAADPDGDPITFSAVSLPAGAVIDNGNVFKWTPLAYQSGSRTITFTATDGKETASASTSITVDTPPTLQPVGDANGNIEAYVGRELAITLSGSDPDPGDQLTYYWVDPSDPQALPVFLAANVYRNTWYVVTRPNGQIPIRFYARDSKGVDSNAVNAVVTVVVPADSETPPVFGNASSFVFGVNKANSFTVYASDPNGQEVRLSAVSVPQSASFDPVSGVFTWTPQSATPSPVTAIFKAEDLDGYGQPIHAVTQNVSIALNSPPVISLVGTIVGTVGSQTAYQVQAVDPDAGDTVSFYADSLPLQATMNSGTGLITWNAVQGQTRTVTATVYAEDNHGNSSNVQASFTTNVLPVLTDPGAKSVTEGQILSFTLAATDGDGDQIAFSATGLPAGATLGQSTGLFTFNPQSTAGSPFNVTFTATDSYGGKASKTVKITVDPKNPPVPVPINTGGGGGGGCFMETLSR